MKLNNRLKFYKEITHKKIKLYLSKINSKFVYTSLLIFITIITLLYVLIIIYAPKLQGYLAFPGVYVNTISHTNPEYKFIDLDFEDINIQYKGENINGLFLDKKSDITIYYLHGNGGDLTYFYHDIKYISDLGYNVLALDYPGYGKSTGFPYETDVLQYAEQLYNFAQEKYKITEKNTIVWGYSVGTGVATQFSVGKDIRSLLLFASYESFYDLSRLNFHFVLQKFLFLPNSFVTIDSIKKILAPKLIIHGTNDDIIDYSQGKNVFLAAGGEKYFIEVEGGDHFSFYNHEYVDTDIRNFLKYNTLDKIFIETTERELLEKEIEKKFWDSLDMTSDSSIQKYVDSKIPFTQKSYVPSDMRRLSREYISDTKGDAQMREQAAAAFEKLAQEFYGDFKEKIVVVSSYRSYSYQAGIKARGCPDNMCAKAGFSEHQSGLTADLWSASTNSYWKNSSRLMEYYNWLDENAHKFGFTNSYKNGITIDGYDIEPWHWRYLGTKIATRLHEENITYAEFYNKNKKQ
ncbi:alpha/beta fold hydrolase [Candidatus Gracilibacteria bacterium]|nr:alpha/beta fold hydrolase [Candidatus Gracilibacteria bacterium]